MNFLPFLYITVWVPVVTPFLPFTPSAKKGLLFTLHTFLLGFSWGTTADFLTELVGSAHLSPDTGTAASPCPSVTSFTGSLWTKNPSSDLRSG